MSKHCAHLFAPGRTGCGILISSPLFDSEAVLTTFRGVTCEGCIRATSALALAIVADMTTAAIHLKRDERNERARQAELLAERLF